MAIYRVPSQSSLNPLSRPHLLPFIPPKVIDVAQVVETDAAQPLVKIVNIVATNEVELAQLITRVKVKAIGQVTETETAQSITRPKIIDVAQVSETETAQPITVHLTKYVAVKAIVQPFVLTSSTTSVNFATSGFTINNPADIQRGDLLISFITWRSASPTTPDLFSNGAPAWTLLLSKLTSGTDQSSVWGYIASGDTLVDTSVLSFSVGISSCEVVTVRLSNHGALQASLATDIKSGGVVGSDDPPSKNAGSISAWRWLEFINSTTVPGGAWVSSGYTEITQVTTDLGGGSFLWSGGGYKDDSSESQTEDPGDSGLSSGVFSFTVAIPATSISEAELAQIITPLQSLIPELLSDENRHQHRIEQRYYIPRVKTYQQHQMPRIYKFALPSLDLPFIHQSGLSTRRISVLRPSLTRPISPIHFRRDLRENYLAPLPPFPVIVANTWPDFPTIRASTGGTLSSGTGPWTVSSPATTEQGDLIVYTIACDITDFHVISTIPNGFVAIIQQNGAGGEYTGVFAGIAADPGVNNHTFSGGVNFGLAPLYQSLAISGHDENPPVITGAYASGAGVTANPPNLSIGTIEPRLWLVITNTWITTVDGNPASYSTVREENSTNVEQRISRRFLSASSEDPGTQNIGSGGWASVTTAIDVQTITVETDLAQAVTLVQMSAPLANSSGYFRAARRYALIRTTSSIHFRRDLRDNYLAFPPTTESTITVVQITETDLAQTITPLKTVTFDQSSETDTAQTITASKTVTVGQATETDTAQTISINPQRRFVNQTSETDLAQTISVNPQRRLINQASETDLAQAITARKTKTLGQITETDLAQSIAVRKTVTLVQTTETDITQTITRVKVRTVNQTLETDTAQAITVNPQRRLVNQTTETGLAQSIVCVKTKLIAQTTETDLAQDVTIVQLSMALANSNGYFRATHRFELIRPISFIYFRRDLRENYLANPPTVTAQFITVNQTTETDTAQSITSLKTKIIGQTTETELAQAITARKTKTVDQTTETDLAQTITARKTNTINQTTETDLVQAITHLKTKTVNQTTETDTAQTITVNPKRRLVNQTTETDIAQTITVNPQRRLIGQASETDTAQPITTNGYVFVVQTTETDTAQAITSRKTKGIVQTTETDTPQTITVNPIHRLVSPASEADTAQSITSRKTKTINQTTETELAQAVTVRKTRTLVQTTETDLAQAITSSKTKALVQTTETDTAQAITFASAQSVNQATETDTALAMTHRKTKTVNQVTETNTAQAMTFSTAHVVSVATETDTAQVIRVRRSYTIAQTTETDLAQSITSILQPTIELISDMDAHEQRVQQRYYVRTNWPYVQSLSVLRYKLPAYRVWDFATIHIQPIRTRQTLRPSLTRPTSSIHFRRDLRENYISYPAPNSIQTIAVGQASETDLAQAMTNPKIRVIVQTTETDLAQTIRVIKSKTLVQTTETDAAQSITHAKTIAVNIVTSTNTAQVITHLKTKSIGQVTETDLAQAITAKKTKTINQASETDTAQIVAHKKIKAVNQTTETDTAQTVSVNPKRRLITAAIETDSAEAISNGRSATVNQTSETDTAQNIVHSKAKAVNQTSETNTAQTISVSPYRRLINRVSETETAQPIIARKSVSISQNLETELAQAINSKKSKVISQVLELSVSQPITANKTYQVNATSETDIARDISSFRRYYVDVDPAEETDAVNNITWFPKTRLIDTAVEFDEAFSITRPAFHLRHKSIDVDIDASGHTVDISIIQSDHGSVKSVAPEINITKPPSGSGRSKSISRIKK